MPRTPTLRLERRPQTVSLVVAMLVLGLGTSGGYYLTSPEPLPLSATRVAATVPTGQTVYLGVFAVGEDADRELELRGVRVEVTSTRDVAVQPLVCLGGTVDVSTEPTGACEDVVDPTSTTLGPGDSIMLQVTGTDATVAVVDPVTVVFAEGLRRGSRPAGAAARVRVLPPAR